MRLEDKTWIQMKRENREKMDFTWVVEDIATIGSVVLAVSVACAGPIIGPVEVVTGGVGADEGGCAAR